MTTFSQQKAAERQICGEPCHAVVNTRSRSFSGASEKSVLRKSGAIAHGQVKSRDVQADVSDQVHYWHPRRPAGTLRMSGPALGPKRDWS